MPTLTPSAARGQRPTTSSLASSAGTVAPVPRLSRVPTPAHGWSDHSRSLGRSEPTRPSSVTPTSRYGRERPSSHSSALPPPGRGICRIFVSIFAKRPRLLEGRPPALGQPGNQADAHPNGSQDDVEDEQAEGEQHH